VCCEGQGVFLITQENTLQLGELIGYQLTSKVNC